MNANGRVNILDNINNSVFQLYDKIPISEKTTNYRNALTGNMESNLLSETFFFFWKYSYNTTRNNSRSI